MAQKRQTFPAIGREKLDNIIEMTFLVFSKLTLQSHWLTFYLEKQTKFHFVLYEREMASYIITSTAITYFCSALLWVIFYNDNHYKICL